MEKEDPTIRFFTPINHKPTYFMFNFTPVLPKHYRKGVIWPPCRQRHCAAAQTNITMCHIKTFFNEGNFNSFDIGAAKAYSTYSILQFERARELYCFDSVAGFSIYNSSTKQHYFVVRLYTQHKISSENTVCRLPNIVEEGKKSRLLIDC